MKNFQYTPQGEEPPKATTFFEIEFTAGGKAMKVEDPLAIAKMTANPNFTEVKEVEVVKEPAKEAPKKRGRPKAKANVSHETED